MYGKQATIDLIKSLLDYDTNTNWGSALRYAVSEIEKQIDNDDDVIDDLTHDIYNNGSPRCDYSHNELHDFIRVYINNSLTNVEFDKTNALAP